MAVESLRLSQVQQAVADQRGVQVPSLEDILSSGASAAVPRQPDRLFTILDRLMASEDHSSAAGSGRRLHFLPSSQGRLQESVGFAQAGGWATKPLERSLEGL